MWKEAVVVQFQMIHHYQNQTTVAVDVQAGTRTGNRQNKRQNFQQKQGNKTAEGSEKRMKMRTACALLSHYAASSGNFLPTFRDNPSVPSSGLIGGLFRNVAAYYHIRAHFSAA